MTQRQAHSMQGSGAWHGGWRALQSRDFGLVEHSCDRLAALNPNPVPREAAQQTGQVNGNREALKASNRFWAKWFEAAHSLEAAQSLIALEAFGKRRAALGTQRAVAKTANKRRHNIVMGQSSGSSWATDGRWHTQDCGPSSGKVQGCRP